MKHLIIGNSAAGIGGVEGIRSVNVQDEITIVTDELYHAYSRPLISYYLANKVKEEQMKFRANDFYQKNNINLIKGKKADKIILNKQKLILNDSTNLFFDRLLIATGGKSFIPPIKGKNKKNIFQFMNLDDIKKIKYTIKNNNLGKGIILGGGLIGLKAAEAFVKEGLEVTVIELANSILNTILDQESAFVVQNYLQKKGVNFRLTDTISEFIGEEELEKVKLKSGIILDCDLAVIAVGVKPNIAIIKDTDIAYNQGILVDKHLKTSNKNIFAAGDVCEGNNMLSKTSKVIPIWPNAYNQGFIAGKNMAGSNEKYEENFAHNSIGFFDLPIITAGIINPTETEKKDYEIYENQDVKKLKYKKLIIKNDKLVGFILVNDIDRAGILTGLIKEGKNISADKEKLMTNELGLLLFEKQWRKEKLAK